MRNQTPKKKKKKKKKKKESEKSDPNIIIILNPTMLYLRDPVSKRVELRHSSFLNGLSEVHNWGELQNDGFFDAPAKEIYNFYKFE